MKKDLQAIREVLSGHAQGLSYGRIHSISGVPKTTVKRIIDLARAEARPVEQLLAMSDEELAPIFLPSRRSQMNYAEPDWESIYLLHEKPRKALHLRVLWEMYLEQTGAGQKAMGYSTFCRGYSSYKANLPTSMSEVSMAFQWVPGDVAMIDYSGDPLHYITRDGKRHKAEIFVGVMAYSHLIFCMATEDQTRQSWLLGIKSMLEYFGAVPQYVFLDNSTTLVTHTDNYDPQYCAEFKGFAGYYGFTPMAVRPEKPRDKGSVEAAVGIVQDNITNGLSNARFLSIKDVNAAISPLLEKLNQRPLSEKSGTRLELFKEEKPTMQPLPEIPYELGLVEKVLKVRSDYQVRLHNRRFSVPYTYAGKTVKVRLWPQTNQLMVYDIRTGKQIAKHHYDCDGPLVNVLLEHMPMNHVMQLRPKEVLLESLLVIGPRSFELGQLIARTQPLRVARRHLSGLLACAKASGAQLAEQVAAAVLSLPEPSFDAYRRELDQRTGEEPAEVKLPRGVRMRVRSEIKNLRGTEYYAKRLASEEPNQTIEKQGEDK